MVTPKSCFSVQLHLSCNTCSCFAVAFTIRCTLRIRNVDVESSSLIHLLPLIGSLFSPFLLLFVFCIACLLRTQLVLYDDSQYYRIAILNGKHSLLSLSLPLTLSLSPAVYFLCKMQKITFIFLGIGFTSSKSQRAKLFAVAQVKNATVHRIGHAHRPHLPEAHSRRMTLLLIPSPSLSLSCSYNIRMQCESF